MNPFDKLRHDLEAAEAAYARLRDAIQTHKNFVDSVNPHPCKADKELHAVLNFIDHGNGLVSPEKPTHSPDCDARDINSEGIVKPCNCGKGTL